jgi:hypothetical protein
MSSDGSPSDSDERVTVYDSKGEPHEIVLRTKSGRVLTDADIWRLAEEFAEGHPDA